MTFFDGTDIVRHISVATFFWGEGDTSVATFFGGDGPGISETEVRVSRLRLDLLISCLVIETETNTMTP